MMTINEALNKTKCNDELIKNFWRKDRPAEAAARALSLPLVEVQKIYQAMDEWRERSLAIKQGSRLLTVVALNIGYGALLREVIRLLAVLALLLLPLALSAQTISPATQEYSSKPGKAITGSFSVTNNGIVPITAVVQRPQSLTFTNGQPHLKALDPTVHVEIDQQSARLGARQLHRFAYRISADSLPQGVTFFVVLTRTVERRDPGGVQFAISLPSTAYVCSSQKHCRESRATDLIVDYAARLSI
jgi:hypothetical protein